VREVVLKGDNVLFVCTKKQLKGIIQAEADRSGAFWVTERWLGGTLTNYKTIRVRLQRLNEIEAMEKDGSINVMYNKKEISTIMREKRKLRRNLEGLRTLERLPAALVVIDPSHEAIAIQEADRIKAATVCLIDTDGNPEVADIAIPCNDDSFRVVQILLGRLADAVIAGRARFIPPRPAAAPAGAPAPRPAGAAPAAPAAARPAVPSVRPPAPPAPVPAAKPVPPPAPPAARKP
jgi:small subunit ribosomal protein S2